MPHITAWTEKTALITGASSGIGAAAARLLAGKGLTVLLTARRVERLNRLCAQIAAAGGRALVFPADLASPEQRLRLVTEVQSACGCPDVLINNAGFGWYGYFKDMPWPTACDQIEVNLIAPAHLVRLFLPAMLERRSGAIVNISSIAGGMPNQGVAIYAAGKAFVDSFTTSLHRELRGSGVTAGSIRPGPVASEFFAQARRSPNSRPVPAERFAVPPEQVARAVWFILRRPRRCLYVPGILALSPWLEHLFPWVIDLLGPLLLRRRGS
jgi:short-subunit dehydrogenase